MKWCNVDTKWQCFSYSCVWKSLSFISMLIVSSLSIVYPCALLDVLMLHAAYFVDFRSRGPSQFQCFYCYCGVSETFFQCRKSNNGFMKLTKLSSKRGLFWHIHECSAMPCCSCFWRHIVSLADDDGSSDGFGNECSIFFSAVTFFIETQRARMNESLAVVVNIGCEILSGEEIHFNWHPTKKWWKQKETVAKSNASQLCVTSLSFCCWLNMLVTSSLVAIRYWIRWDGARIIHRH